MEAVAIGVLVGVAVGLGLGVTLVLIGRSTLEPTVDALEDEVRRLRAELEETKRRAIERAEGAAADLAADRRLHGADLDELYDEFPDAGAPAGQPGGASNETRGA